MLYNKYSKEELIKQLNSETFNRRTLSFYRYVIIENIQEFRDSFYQALSALQCNGRIYIAREGINAQMNVPEHAVSELLALLDSYTELQNIV